MKQTLPLQTRLATFKPQSANTETRTIEVVWSSGAAVKRFSSLFDQDWDQGTPYDPPDPVSVLPAPEEEDELTVRLGPDDDVEE